MYLVVLYSIIVFSVYFSTLALKKKILQMCMEHTSIMCYIFHQYDVYLHMKCGKIPSNPDFPTLVVFVTDLLKCVLNGLYNAALTDSQSVGRYPK